MFPFIQFSFETHCTGYGNQTTDYFQRPIRSQNVTEHPSDHTPTFQESLKPLHVGEDKVKWYHPSSQYKYHKENKAKVRDFNQIDFKTLSQAQGRKLDPCGYPLLASSDFDCSSNPDSDLPEPVLRNRRKLLPDASKDVFIWEGLQYRLYYTNSDPHIQYLQSRSQQWSHVKPISAHILAWVPFGQASWSTHKEIFTRDKAFSKADSPTTELASSFLTILTEQLICCGLGGMVVWKGPRRVPSKEMSLGCKGGRGK